MVLTFTFEGELPHSVTETLDSAALALFILPIDLMQIIAGHISRLKQTITTKLSTKKDIHKLCAVSNYFNFFSTSKTSGNPKLMSTCVVIHLL